MNSIQSLLEAVNQVASGDLPKRVHLARNLSARHDFPDLL